MWISEEEEGRIPAATAAPVASPDEAALLYTSGTTGKPKGCILTNEYFMEVGRLYTGLGGYCRFEAGDSACDAAAGDAHECARRFVHGHAHDGRMPGPARSVSSFDVVAIASRCSRATAFHYLGVMPAMLLKAPPAPSDDCRDVLRFGFGAGVDPRHHAAFEHAIRRAADRGLGDDRDRSGRVDHRQPGAAPRWAALLRQGAAGSGLSHRR